MEILDIEQFNPTVAELNALVDGARKVLLTDINDKKQLELVRETRLSLKNARVLITKTGKDLREDALKFQKVIIAKEKELIAIIEPEEERLQAIEDQAKEIKIREERMALLPIRKEQLSKIGDGLEVTDDELLAMDSSRFQEYVNQRVAAKNEADRVALAKREDAMRAEEQRLEQEKQNREREDRAREEERKRVEERIKEETERVEREQRERVEREVQEKAAVEARAKAEKERLGKEKRYKEWLNGHGYCKEEAHLFFINDTGGQVALYKFVDIYIK